MNVFALIAEKKIQEAMERGEFENLEGMGAPLVYEDDSMIPEDLRMAYKILKNAGYVPPEVQARKDIMTLTDLLSDCRDERERCLQMRKLQFLTAKMDALRPRRLDLEKEEGYYQKLVERVSVRGGKNTS